MKWTKQQQQVIDARGSDLLVSAAAGSGKTAVLVERIIQLICDEQHPVDIDRLLVMTFTNAAAAEMRERISRAIERKLEERPDSEHLQVQAALVHRAQITTIDSFCLSLIRDHFNLLDLDPAFRIGDPGELMLLRADVMEQLLEDFYESGDPVFGEFVETYATGKSDNGIEDYIMQVYTFSQSNPFPEEWFAACEKELLDMEEGNPTAAAWMEFLMADTGRQVQELEEQLERAMEVCQLEGGPQVYLPTLQTELEMLRGIKAARDYKTLHERLEQASFGRIAAARGKQIDPEKKEYAAACRDRVKKAVGALKNLYGQQTEEEAIGCMLASRQVVLKLLELAREFHRRYQESKKDKNIVDFNDLEHEALRILVKNEEGTIRYTSVADELSKRYAEILVDEYQDSNDVQETLIESLSAKRFGRPDVFMVGDVKQSIYKFRLARPELFMKKYSVFGEEKEENGGRKIELRQNFRSRASVLDSVNYICFQIMTNNLGNISYTDQVALHPGAMFQETEKAAGTPTELLLVDTGTKVLGPADQELEEYTSREMEARLIASRIRQLTDPEEGLWVWDKETETYRTARYGDMVILLRSLTGWTDSFLNVLTQEGIPALAETGTGYFNTVEVETVLAMLAVIDNPMQDIPLAAVLKSAMAGMDEEELAWMMAAAKKQVQKGQDRGIYGAMKLVLGEEIKRNDGETWGQWELRREKVEESGGEWENSEEELQENDKKWGKVDGKATKSEGEWETETFRPVELSRKWEGEGEFASDYEKWESEAFQFIELNKKWEGEGKPVSEYEKWEENGEQAAGYDKKWVESDGQSVDYGQKWVESGGQSIDYDKKWVENDRQSVNYDSKWGNIDINVEKQEEKWGEEKTQEIQEGESVLAQDQNHEQRKVMFEHGGEPGKEYSEELNEGHSKEYSEELGEKHSEERNGEYNEKYNEWEIDPQNSENYDKKWGLETLKNEIQSQKWETIGNEAGVPEEMIHRIQEKITAFSRLLGQLRKEAAYLPIHELIHRMYLRTGYYDYVSAMPAGEARKANLDMLIEKASAYEKTSYKGLFHFIRYIERLKQYDTDFGEATAAGKTQQMVRIMSIHKSKGLEFPIVFLAGLGKSFNKQDVRGKLILDADLGIGTDYLDVETRVRTATLKKQVLKRKMDLDNLGEELRVLYVAMTRAKEKLIMTATDRSLEKKLERWRQKTWDSTPIPYTILTAAGSCLDWILMTRPYTSPLFSVEQVPVESLVGEAVARKVQNRVSEEELRTMDLTVTYDQTMAELLKERLSYQYPYEADTDLHTKVSVSELKKQGQDLDDKNSLFQPLIPEFLKKDRKRMEEEERQQEETRQNEIQQEEAKQNEMQQEETEQGENAQRETKQIEGEESETAQRETKQIEGEESETAQWEIKHKEIEQNERDQEEIKEKATGENEREQEKTQQKDVTQEEIGQDESPQGMSGAGGAFRGSAYHRVLELLDFSAINRRSDVSQWMEEAYQEGRITRDALSMIRPAKIWRFLQTSLGKRMRQAQKEGHLFREQQFVMGVPACEMKLGDSEELVLIQGIIDAWIEEEDGLVLIDYKTDQIRPGQEELLVKRYGVQLDYYKRALEQIRKKPVKERIIYSLSLQKEIHL